MTCNDYIIIYFSLRKSKYVNYWNEGQHYDVILMRNQNIIKCSDFKEIRNRISKQKTIKCYENNRSEKSILKECQRLSEKNRQEYKYNLCPFETKFNNIMIYRLPSIIYAKMVLELKAYLSRNLEKEFWDYFSKDIEYAYPNIHLGGGFYSNNKWFYSSVELGFHDIELAKQREQKNGNNV